MGCVTSETNFFYTQKADGILGLKSTKKNNIEPFIYELYNKGAITTKSIALCLGNTGGHMTFGGYPSSLLLSDLKYTWFESEQFKVGIKRILLDEFILEGSTNIEVVIDSGTTYTYFGSTLFDHLMNKLDVYCKKQGSCRGVKSYTSHDKCLTLQNITDEEFLKSYPIMFFEFSDSVVYEWYPSDYMVKVNDSSYCIGVDWEYGNKVMLGGTFLHNHMAYFDMQNRKFGFANANCTNNTEYKPPVYNQSAINDTLEIIKVMDNTAWDVHLFVIIGGIIILCGLIVLIILCRRRCKRNILQKPSTPRAADSIEIVVK